ncbi:hypothetical protein ACXLPV_004829 [Vibrio parahaemolyticus]
MLYINEVGFERQIELLKFISNQSTFAVCLWLYPDSNVLTIAEQKVIENSGSIQPITEYSHGVIPKHTELKNCTTDFLNLLLSFKNEVIENCDSIALYNENNSNWAVATIGHEGMSLVRDITLLDSLKYEGFSVSLEPPSWW